MRAFHAVDDAAHRIRRLDRERLGITARGHERQHHHVGIAVEKHVFHEFLGSQAIEVTARSGLWRREPQPALGDHLKASAGAVFTQAPVGSTKWPCTSKINSPLPPTLACASCGSSAASGFEFEEAAALAGCGVGRIEREQRARRAASRNQKIAAAKTQALRVLARRLVRQAVAGAVGRRKRQQARIPRSKSYPA